MKYLRFTLSLLIVLTVVLTIGGQGALELSAATSYRITEKVYPTYPYGDPNPIPTLTRFYPYFRFDGFSVAKTMKKWKVVELSNDYITMDILPEIGGKIWSVTEKSTGKSIIYSNPVIKFRDVGMRGPWTSGGIEVNVGIIGHTPNCSSPVDYQVRKNADGSVSCFIGALDLIARANWQVEICLPEKSAVFSMRFFWHNGSGQTQPYYTWTNVGVRSNGGMKAVDPGTNFIGHGGEIDNWPKYPQDGRDLSVYENNNFGTYKSYHILGNLAEFYGVYYHQEDFGVASIIPTEGKRGRKIWIWGLSRQGMIWEDLLTDPPGGQYVEIQAGRLFNQCRGESSFTPFKNREFAPYSTDRWMEYWLPVMKIGGYKTAGIDGAMNVETKENNVTVQISPARVFKADLKIYEGDKVIWHSEKPIEFKTLVPYKWEKTFSFTPKNLKVVLGDDLLTWPGDAGEELSRSWVSKIDQKKIESPSADYQLAREMMRDRQFAEADKYYKKCLEKDPLYLTAYTGLAENAHRKGNYQQAADYAREALAIDIYDAGANYQFGLASLMLNRLVDAKEAFSLAVLPDYCRSAGFTGLAKTRLKSGNDRRAVEAADQALQYNTGNVDALTVRCAAIRKTGSESEKKESIQRAKNFLTDNPLLSQVRAELFLAGAITSDDFINAVQCELPHETFLEIVAWYKSLGCYSDAVQIIKAALTKKGIRKTELKYYLAFLEKDKKLLTEAEKESPDFCFPFRAESLEVFQWAVEKGSSWRNKYYDAILLAFLEQPIRALQLLNECGDRPDYAPFYAMRGDLTAKRMADLSVKDDAEIAIKDDANAEGDSPNNKKDSSNNMKDSSKNKSGSDLLIVLKNKVERDYKKAFELVPDSPRYAGKLAQFFADHHQKKDLLNLTEIYIKKFPTDTKLVLLRATAYLENNRYEEGFEFLRTAVFLPAEGSLLARDLYFRFAFKMAEDCYQSKKYQEALDWCNKARLWPENLGSGKPYPEYCDERLEDWISYLCLTKLGKKDQAVLLLDKIIHPVSDVQKKIFEKNERRILLTALALQESGKSKEAFDLLKNYKGEKAKLLLEYFNKNNNDDIKNLIQEVSP